MVQSTHRSVILDSDHNMGTNVWKKGVSANPSGRPSGSRSIADSLRKIGKEKVKYNGKYTTKEDVLARMIYDGIVTFKAVSPEGKILSFSPKLWLDLTKFTLNHVDGPASASLDITSGGQPVKGYIGFTLDQWDDIVEGEVIEDDTKLLNSG